MSSEKKQIGSLLRIATFQEQLNRRLIYFCIMLGIFAALVYLANTLRRGLSGREEEFFDVLLFIVVIMNFYLYILIAASTIAVLAELNNRRFTHIVLGFMCIFPLAPIFLALKIDFQLFRMWRRFGLKRRLFDTHQALLEKLKDGDLCFGCGYSLQGNVSGICPECGNARLVERTPVAETLGREWTGSSDRSTAPI